MCYITTTADELFMKLEKVREECVLMKKKGRFCANLSVKLLRLGVC